MKNKKEIIKSIALSLFCTQFFVSPSYSFDQVQIAGGQAVAEVGTDQPNKTPIQPNTNTGSSDVGFDSGPLSSAASSVQQGGIPAAQGSAFAADLGNGNYSITDNNVVLTNANEKSKAIVTINSGYQSQQVTNAINVGPQHWTYSPNYSAATVALTSGSKATLSDSLGMRSGGNLEPASTLPQFVMINGQFTQLEVKPSGSDPLGIVQYDVSFTVPTLRGDGTDWIKFLSKYDDTTVLVRSYLIDSKGIMREVPDGYSLPIIKAPVSASHGTETATSLGNGNYRISSNGITLSNAQEKEKVVVTANSSYQPQQVTNAINIGPQRWTYYPSYSSQTILLTAGAKVTLSDSLASRASGNVEPMATLPQFAMINGEFVALELKKTGVNPLGVVQYEVSFTVPQLKGDGTDQIKFLSQYDSKTILVKSYLIDSTGLMREMAAGLPFGWGMTSNPAYGFQIAKTSDGSTVLKIINLKTAQITKIASLSEGGGTFQTPISLSSDGKVIVYGTIKKDGYHVVVEKADGSGTGRTLDGKLAGAVVFQSGQVQLKIMGVQDTQPKTVTIAYANLLTMKQQKIYKDFQLLLGRDPTVAELTYWTKQNLNSDQIFSQLMVVQERLNQITAVLRNSLGYAPSAKLVRQIALTGKSYLQIANDYH